MSLRSDANLVRNATQVDPPENDEARIGGLFKDIADVAETVDTIADLKSYADASIGDIVKVRSYNSGVDGGGGYFRLIDGKKFTITNSSGTTFSQGSLQFPTMEINESFDKGALFKFENGGIFQADESGVAGEEDVVNGYVLTAQSIQAQEQGYIFRSRETRLEGDGNSPDLTLPEGIIIESDVLSFGLVWERILEGDTDIRMWGAIPNSTYTETGNNASPAIQAAQNWGGTIRVLPSNTGVFYNMDEPVEINRPGVEFVFGGKEDVYKNEEANIKTVNAVLYTNNSTQNFFDFFPNAPNQFDMFNFKFVGNITTLGISGYSGKVFNYVLSAGMRNHYYDLYYTGNWPWMIDNATFGDGGTIWYVDYENTSTVNGFLAQVTFDGFCHSAGRGVFISENPTPSDGNFTNGYYIYFRPDNMHQPIKLQDGGGVSIISTSIQTRSNLDQSEKSLEPMVDVDTYGCLVDVQLWDIRSNTSGRTTPQRGVKFYPADNPSRAINRTLLNDRFGFIEGLENTAQNTFLRDFDFNIPMRRNTNGQNISWLHNTFLGIDLKGADAFNANHYNATGYDLDANLTESSALPASDGITLTDMQALCRHSGENIDGNPTFVAAIPEITYSSSVDVDNDFVEIVYEVDVLGTIDIERVDIRFRPSGASCKEVQVIGLDRDGTTVTGSEKYTVLNPATDRNEFLSFNIGDPNGFVIIRFIGYGDSGGGSIEIDDIAGYMGAIENNNMPLMPRTGGPMWNDVVYDRNGTGPVIESPDGTKYRITVDNAGSLSATAV